MQGEGWRGAQHRRAEILEDRDLPLGVAVRDGMTLAPIFSMP